MLKGLFAAFKTSNLSKMPLRNPFRKTFGGVEAQDENRPISKGGVDRSGFEKTTVAGSKPVDIKEPVEYKLSGMDLNALRPVCRIALRTMRAVSSYYRELSAYSSQRSMTVGSIFRYDMELPL